MKPSIRMAIWDRDGGLCQYTYLNGRKCLAPASELHHVNPKQMGGRKHLKETAADLECRCWLHNHAVLIDGRYYMGHTK